MKTMEFSVKFWAGVILLLINQPIGWIALVICNGLSVKNQDSDYCLLGFGIYGLTWGILGLGFLFSGRDGMKYSWYLFNMAKKYLRDSFKKK
jgi:hypothetical protein